MPFPIPKVVREKDKAEQVAERARQRQAQTATRALQSSQKGKRKTLQPLKQDTKRRKQVVDAVGSGEASEAGSAALPKTTRRGRKVGLPDKYK
jgi:hypothetical protein